MLTSQSSAAASFNHPDGEPLSHNGRGALAYVRAGYFVFPCASTREKHKPTDRLPFGKATKTPLVNWDQEATKDENKIREWWTKWPDALIALPCKQNHLFLIDAGRHTAEQDGIAEFDKLCEGRDEPMPQHPFTITDYEGQHHIFAMPDPPVATRIIGTGIETRGYKPENSGGYFIAAGSLMPDGRRWGKLKGTPSLINDGPPPLPPHWLIELCRPQQKQEAEPVVIPFKPSGKNEEAYALSTLNRVASELSAQREGYRDNSLVSVAGTMGRMMKAGWIGYSTIEGRLVDACKNNGLLQEIGEAKVRDKIKRSAKAVGPHEPLKERPAIKGNGKGEAGVDDLLPAHTWDDCILDDRRGELPAFPVDVFTPPWQEWLLRASHGAGVRPEHVAVPLLGIAASLIGTARRVRASRSWSEPMTLWTCIVAHSGDRKTPGLNVTVRALDLIEKNNSAETSKKRLSHETRVQRAKEIHKKWKEDREAALKKVPPLDPPSMPMDAIDPGGFIEPRLYATDPTIERLAPLLQARPRGMMLIRDELSGLFANMGRYNKGSDRPFWLEAWNGGRHIVERVSIVVDHLMVGVVGCFQPDRLQRAFAGDEDGMYGRFLYAWPLAPDYRPLTNETSEVEPELQNALTALIRLPSEDQDGVFATQAVWLSDDAIVEFEEFRKFVHKEKCGLDGHERQWFGKGESVVLRLAGVLAYMAWAINLGNPSANGALPRLWREFFWPHARAAMRQIGLSDRHKSARRVLRWIRHHGKREVSLEEIRQNALGKSMDAEHTRELMNGLERGGWLKLERFKTAGRPKQRWPVNPKLFVSTVPPESLETPESPN
jgi:hypothetical protein